MNVSADYRGEGQVKIPLMGKGYVTLQAMNQTDLVRTRNHSLFQQNDQEARHGHVIRSATSPIFLFSVE
jgi:hypothetical protein